MKRWCVLGILVLASFSLAGCTSHLVFAENSHMGLKASFEPNNPTPAEIDIGWRRAVFAMVPKKSAEAAGKERGTDGTASAPPGSVTVTTTQEPGGNGKKQTEIEVVPDPNELMSMYAVYRGNIGFGDPIDVYHFMATGVAASNLLASRNELRDLIKQLNPPDSKEGEK